MTTTTATDQRLLDRLLASPVGVQMREEDAAERAANRKAHIEAIAKLEKQAADELPGLAALRDMAAKERVAALEYVRAAEQRFNETFAAHLSASTRIDNSLEKHRRELERTADQKIDEYLGRLAGELDRCRSMSTDSMRSTSKNIRTLGDQVVITNRPKITSKIHALVSFREAVKTWRYELATTAELQERFDTLWAELPSTELK